MGQDAGNRFPRIEAEMLLLYRTSETAHLGILIRPSTFRSGKPGPSLFLEADIVPQVYANAAQPYPSDFG